MISIIISSAKSELLDAIISNIKLTIGVPFEIIATDNSNAKFGICEIYNKSAEQAKFDILCFMHEDIEILTNEWGQKIIEAFNNNKLGIVGVVGSAYKAFAPSGWWAESEKGDLLNSNYIQSYKRSNKEEEFLYSNPLNLNLANVVCVDGLWFCTTKQIALAYPFDEKILKGFHCYDIDFCLKVGQYFNVAVTFEVLIRHFSEGSYDKYWLSDTIKIHKKYEDILPKSIIKISNEEAAKIEKRAFKTLIINLIKDHSSLSDIFNILKSYRGTKAMDNYLYLKLNLYALKFHFNKKILIAMNKWDNKSANKLKLKH